MKAHHLETIVAGLGELQFHDDDELLLILDGHADITVLTDDGPIVTPVKSGCAFIVPRGLWHRHTLHGTVKEFYVTPGRSEHSTADDPRTERTSS